MRRIRYSKINIIGAQCTGKTTLVQALEADKEVADKFRFLAGTIPAMAEEDKTLDISPAGDPTTQHKLFSYYAGLLENVTLYIADRSIVDVVSYTSEMYDNETEEPRKTQFAIEEQWERRQLLSELKLLNPCLNIYLPIDDGIELIADGYRCVDENHRQHIDAKIRQILTNNAIPYTTVRGTVEERVEQVKQLVFV